MVLEELGLATERPDDINAVMRVLDGLTTAGGHARRRRLEYCGVAFPALTADDEMVWLRRGCRDRYCPSCGDALGRRVAAAIHRRADRVPDERLVSLVLTRPKVADEPPAAALSAIAGAFGDLTRTPLLMSRGKRQRPPVLPGGVRMLECSARAAGEVIAAHAGRPAYRVARSGIHAHLHVLAEVRAGLDGAEAYELLLDAWERLVPGMAREAQHLRLLQRADIAAACAYGASFGALARLVDVAPRYARAVAIAMHRRVLVRAWGSWRSCLRPAPSGVRMGDRSIASIVLAPGGLVRFGDQVRQASDVYRQMLQRPRRLGDE